MAETELPPEVTDERIYADLKAYQDARLDEDGEPSLVLDSRGFALYGNARNLLDLLDKIAPKEQP